MALLTPQNNLSQDTVPYPEHLHLPLDHTGHLMPWIGLLFQLCNYQKVGFTEPYNT